jgi:hypothetical protein
VWNIFVCFLSTPSFEILLLPLFWRGLIIHHIFFLCSLIGAHFFYASWAYTLCFVSMNPLSFCKNTRRQISLDFEVFIFGGWMACFV